MNILVTGGAGFIGSHLCRRLVNEGNTVVCLDNFFTGRLKNIEDIFFKNKNHFIHVQGDITEKLPFESGFDQIYNLACPASPPHYQENPLRTLNTNYLGVLNMLEFARKCKNAKFLQTSTSEVYGDPEVHPQVETYRGNVNTMGIRSCYDEGKRVAETLCFEFRHMYNLDTKVVRIFNTYGPNMRPDDGRIISNFICQALTNKDLTIYGDGSQTRSFCYVDDLVDGLIKMMNSDEQGPINLGNPGEFTVLEAANKIIAATNSNSKLVYKELPQDDPTRRKPDISLAKSKLNWEPTINLDQGLIKTIDYFRGEI